MQLLTDYLKTRTRRPFKAAPVYAPEGDSLTFIFEDAPYYAERIDDFLTVYRALGNANGSEHRLVGCQLKGVPKVLALLGAFQLTINDDPIHLNLIFFAMATSVKNVNDITPIYIDLANHDEVKKAQVKPTLFAAAA